LGLQGSDVCDLNCESKLGCWELTVRG